ncbi:MULTISPECIES: hypothetical protein [Streptomyces]|uniref:Uncharacterized protein n=2 Tax=Streptomyces TaxID=1883 RepID=A0A100Y1Q3_9ACTN|nr:MULTISPECIES: hypothetical protein [Streptomyces]KUH36087.1 hypothetical protein ATE80_25485 [Streptomyces kanasensis]UUS31688.1 hypothetical protein NRO40_13155 [Streptomyces changanensis]
MNLPKPLDTAPSWVPASGHALRHAGVHFDAVRIAGMLAEEVTYRLMTYTDFQAGPIVRQLAGQRNMYFLVPPQTAAAYGWPGGRARALSRGAGCAAYVGVPALDGLTWPLDWRSRPTRDMPFVDPELLHHLLLEVL